MVAYSFKRMFEAPILEGRALETRFPWAGGGVFGPIMVRVGKHAAGALLDGQKHQAFPRPLAGA